MEKHKWGDFEITEVLGKGGMGIVYKGRQISLDRPVAIKVLPSTLTKKTDFVERFYREAKAVAKINCPQIIQVYGAGEFEGKHYFDTEYRVFARQQGLQDQGVLVTPGEETE